MCERAFAEDVNRKVLDETEWDTRELRRYEFRDGCDRGRYTRSPGLSNKLYLYLPREHVPAFEHLGQTVPEREIGIR